jgi:hypothetical protein
MKTASASKVIQLFNKLSRPEQVEIVDQLTKETFNDRWEELERELPDIEISEEEIMKDVRAVRYDEQPGE